MIGITLPLASPCRMGLLRALMDFRDECLNETLFSSFDEARQKITEWKEDYNQVRPHSSLGNMAPNEFTMKNINKNTLQKLAA